jgi:hypothetical protein
LQGNGLAVFVPLNTDEAGIGIIGACSRECWYEACQYQKRLEDETHLSTSFERARGHTLLIDKLLVQA